MSQDKIEDYLKYWTNQGMSKDNLKKQFKLHNMKYVDKSNKQTLVSLYC